MRNLGTILAAAAASLFGAVLLPACMSDPMSGGAGTYDGPVSLTLNLGFDPLAESLATRGVAANLDFELRDLALFFYDGDADEQTPPVKTYTFTDLRTEQAERVSKDGVDPHTRRTSVTLDDIASGSYRIYAAANVAETLADNGIPDLSLLSERALRGLTVTWAPYAEDAGEDEQSPLRYAIPDAMYGFFDSGDEQDVIGKRAPVIALASRSVTLHAWLKRVVSRLTVGFDGSQLNDGVAIYIQSVRVRDAVAASLLGENNAAGSKQDLFADTRTDRRLNHVYSTEEGVTDVAITKDTPAFPRPAGNDGISTRNDDGSGWNADWYDYVHGNAATLDPAGPVDENTPVALYFMENMQGTGSKIARDNDPTGETYKKDEKLLGTYVEVNAYYTKKDINTGMITESDDIVYRFMLGQNITDDFNVERSRHYKLTLRFKGDANNPDWHIEYPAVKTYYFRIPYNLDDDAEDFAFVDTPNDEHWYLNENWKQSYVWYAYYDDGNSKVPIAEIVKELIYYDDDYTDTDFNGQKFYQVVTVYPITKDGRTDLENGIIVQVLDCDDVTETAEKYFTKDGGALISMYYRYERPAQYISGQEGDKAQNSHYTIKSCELTPDIADGTGVESHQSYWYIEYDAKTGTISPSEVPMDILLPTRPYREEDKSGNLYPIVKIGASYWFRENMRSTSLYSAHEIMGTGYEGSQEIEEWKAGQENDDIPPEYCGSVYIPENVPMYKKADPTDDDGTQYGFLYNLATIAGSAEYDPWAFLFEEPSNLVDGNESGYLYQLEDQFIDWSSNNRERKGINDWQICPKGWHLPTGMDGQQRMPNDPDLPESRSFGEFWQDHQYMMYYLGSDLFRAAVNKGRFVWPSTGYPGEILKKNLSGLSLLPMPADGESTTLKLGPSDVLNAKNIQGLSIPYWMPSLTSVKGYLYPFTSIFYYENGKLETMEQVGSSTIDLRKDSDHLYLPIRPCRNSFPESYIAQSWSDMDGNAWQWTEAQ